MSIINIIMAAAGNTATGPWDLAGARYTGQPFPATQNGIDSAPSGVFFKPDGLKMFVCGFGADAVYEYTLSTAWSVGTAVYTGVSFSAAAQDTTIKSISMSSDGTKMFLAGDTNNTIYQYTLSTAWSLSTASYASKSKSVSAEMSVVGGLAFNVAGTSMYVGTGSSLSGTVYQYTLSTAWDVSTATYSLKSYAGIGASVGGVFLTSSDTRMYILSEGNETVYSYDLSTAGDVSTATPTGQSVFIGFLDSAPYGLFISPTGDKMYLTAALVQERVFEFVMSTNFNLTTARFAYQLPNMFYLGQQIEYPTGMYMTADGLNMYFTKDLGSGNSVTQYALATAWDIKSTTYTGKSYSIAAQDTLALGISLSTDKTKMFVFGDSSNRVYMYTLSTAGDVSTASYSGTSFSLATQSTSTNSLFFTSNGLYFYVVSATSDIVFQYNLSVAWDLTTAVYSSKSFSVVAQLQVSRGVFVSPDGVYLFVINGASPANVYQYAMTTAFDVSTAYYTNRSFSFSNQEPSGDALFFKPDGFAMYLAGNDNRTVFQYALGP